MMNNDRRSGWYKMGRGGVALLLVVVARRRRHSSLLVDLCALAVLLDYSLCVERYVVDALHVHNCRRRRLTRRLDLTLVAIDLYLMLLLLLLAFLFFLLLLDELLSLLDLEQLLLLTQLLQYVPFLVIFIHFKSLSLNRDCY